MGKDLQERCREIKAVLTDVDGVLTDGGMYYTNKGDVMKRFFVRDGMGVTLLRRKSISTIIITKEKTAMVRQWAKRMKIAKVYEGIIQKETILDEICKKFKIMPNEIAYIGDDINDISLLKKIGFSAAPNDASNEVKKICNYKCKTNSGHGAFRELVDLILSNK